MKIIWLSKTRTFSLSTRYGLLVLGSFVGLALFVGFLSGVIYHQYRAESKFSDGAKTQSPEEKIQALTQILAELQVKLMTLESMQKNIKTSQTTEPAPDTKISENTANDLDAQGGPFIPKDDFATQSLGQLQKKNLDEIINASKDSLLRANSFESNLHWLQQNQFSQFSSALYQPTMMPVNNGRLASRFGFRRDPFNYSLARHEGLDFAAPIGTPYYAAAAGVVELVRFGGDYGWHVIVDHGNGYKTLYAHSSHIFVTPGQVVQKGQFMGEIGSSGRSTGPHLHFEVHRNGMPINPEEILNLANLESSPFLVHD